jgi:hypothetical protein
MATIAMPRSTTFLERQAELVQEAERTITTGRASLMARVGALYARFWPAARPVELVAPLWTRADGTHRSAPRDGRGRLLSKRWLAEAESFTAADLAWFRPEAR